MPSKKIGQHWLISLMKIRAMLTSRDSLVSSLHPHLVAVEREGLLPVFSLFCATTFSLKFIPRCFSATA